MLPAWLDAVSERWWTLGPRVRVVVVVAGLLLVAAGAGVRTLASPFGPPVAVLIAADDLPAGTTLEPALLRAARWPRDLVPRSAARDPTGTLTLALPAGAVLTERHRTAEGLAGRIGDGRAAVALRSDLLPEVPGGARVRLVGTDVGGAARVLADDARVLTHDPTTVWLEVPDGAAAQVAAAVLSGTVAVVLLPP